MFGDIVKEAAKLAAEATGSEPMLIEFVDDAATFVHARYDGVRAATIAGVDADKQLAVLPYSSGTTGLPKGTAPPVLL